MKTPKYLKGDMVVYKLVKTSTVTYYGVIVSNWRSQDRAKNIIYEIASLSDGMCSYSIGEQYIIKKVS